MTAFLPRLKSWASCLLDRDDLDAILPDPVDDPREISHGTLSSGSTWLPKASQPARSLLEKNSIAGPPRLCTNGNCVWIIVVGTPVGRGQTGGGQARPVPAGTSPG